MKRSERQEVVRAAVALLLALAVLVGVPTLDWKSRPDKPEQQKLYQATLGGEGAPAPAGEPGAAAQGVHFLDKQDVKWAQTLKAGLEAEGGTDEVERVISTLKHDVGTEADARRVPFDAQWLFG